MKNIIHLPLIDVESEHCARIVDNGLALVEGLKQHKVELNNNRAVIEVDPAKTNAVSNAVSKIRDLGYDVETVKETLPVTGMTCASCAISVESMLQAQPGVIHASVNVATNTVLVEYIPGAIAKEQMKIALQSVGYDLEIGESEDARQQMEDLKVKHFKQLRFKTIASVVLCIPLIVVGMFFMHAPFANYIQWALATPIVLVFGGRFFVNAYKQARNKSSNMDTLVALSTGAAYLFSVFNTLFPEYWHSRGMHPEVYFESAGVVIAFILLGKLLEDRAKSNTSSAIKKLIGMQPKTVLRIHEDGSEQTIPIAQVQINDLLLVKPGDRIPVDGLVKQGHSSVDESSITGEPVPVEKQSGALVYAGTINQKGALHITAQKVGGETVLAQIIKMVQEAQGSKAPVQKLVDKIAGIFVPVVILIAIMTFLVWMFFGGEHALTHAMLSMITVLVIACPCALGLATPTALMVGIGKGAELGILIKDAESLEQNKKIDAIILDKTGTITEGKPEVTDLIWYTEQNKPYAALLGAIEKQSEHPLADAVYKHVTDETETQQTFLFDSFESITGRGVKAMYQGKTFLVGNRKLMNEHAVIFSDQQDADLALLLNQSKTVVFFAADKIALAIIAISDKIKSTSASAIQQLHDAGIEVFMLTGDNAATAKQVAETVGISTYKAEVLPGEKASFIRELQAKGKTVAMVGDGINDSQALALADVSIAMGKGSDIAIDVAKMTIISSDLTLIPKAIQLSKQTVRVIRQNLFWAFIYNLIGIPIAAGILYPSTGFLLNPMIAGAAMAMSSVSVVANSLLLKFRKR
ncbi:MAG: heavy metal translocating P-type ATPase [Bacteroidia bacterium]|jgi:Cu2+-exporting ATPase